MLGTVETSAFHNCSAAPPLTSVGAAGQKRQLDGVGTWILDSPPRPSRIGLLGYVICYLGSEVGFPMLFKFEDPMGWKSRSVSRVGEVQRSVHGPVI